MSENRLDQPSHPYRLSQDLTHLYQEFVEYQEACSCFCESLRGLLGARPTLGPTTVLEVVRFLDHLQDNGTQLRTRFQAVHREYCTAQPAR